MATSLKPSAIQGLSGKDATLLVHAPWCGHCVRFMPEYEKFAESAAAKATVAKINGAKYGDTLRAGGADYLDVMKHVRGFPTLIFFRADGEREVYSGPRTAESVGNAFDTFVNKGQKEVIEGGGSEPVPALSDGVYLFKAEWCGHCKRFKPTFEKFVEWASDRFPGATFKMIDHDSNRLVSEAYGVKSFPTVIRIANGEVEEFNSQRTLENLKAYAEQGFGSPLSAGGAETTTSVISIKPSAVSDVLNRNAVVLAHATWCGHCVKFMPEYENTKVPGHITKTRIDVGKYGDAIPSTITNHVVGVPTVLFVKDGDVTSYNGQRNAASLEEAIGRHF